MTGDKNIIISNHEKLEEIKKRISAEGPEKFHMLADFDRWKYGLCK